MVSNLPRFVPPEVRTKKSLQKNLGVSAGLTTNRHDLRRPSEEGHGYRSGPTCNVYRTTHVGPGQATSATRQHDRIGHDQIFVAKTRLAPHGRLRRKESPL